MSELCKKWLLWGSLIILLLSIGGLVFTSIIPFSDTVDIIQMTIVLVLILSILNLMFLLANKYQNRNGFRKTIRILSYFLPVLLLLLFSFDFKWLSIDSDLLFVVCLSGIFILIPVTMMYLFVLNDTKVIMGIIVILFYIIIGLVLRRLNWGDPEYYLITGFLMIGSGMYCFGLKSILIIEKNRFLKTVSFIACLLIYFGGFIMMYSSFTYANTIVIVYSISIFLLTLIVLLSLPVSGYVQWISLHKSILKKILIPWVFFLLIISIRFVFPELNSLFFREKQGHYQEFIMYDYPVTNKNGLEPE